MRDILLASLGRYIPECLSIVTMVFLLYLESTYKNDEEGNKNFLFISAGLGLLATLGALLANVTLVPTAIFTNAIVIDPFSTILKILMVLSTMACIYLAYHSKDLYQSTKAEFTIMCVGVLIGGMLLASANNLLTVYLGIETLSILSYCLATFKKYDSKSSEAGLKYVLYGGISAGIMLFGMSYIYGILGTIQFVEMPILIQSLTPNEVFYLVTAFVFFFVGIGYKISCVPFHMWAPDVYEGSPLPVTAFFALVPKIAGIAALVRVSSVFIENNLGMEISWIGVLSAIAALTITVGNVSAINQKSVKRMLAYSSISHAGIMILGVVVVSDIGVRSIVFYGITYLFMTLVAFYVTSFVSDKFGNDHFERFSGMIRKYPMMAIAMTIAMLSLAGVPPFSGFIAKFNIIYAVILKKHYVLAVIAGLNSVVSVYYYMRVVRLMTLREPESSENIDGFSFVNQLIICILAIPIVAIGIFWEKILFISESAKLF